jgi:hypothetical protein
MDININININIDDDVDADLKDFAANFITSKQSNCPRKLSRPTKVEVFDHNVYNRTSPIQNLDELIKSMEVLEFPIRERRDPLDIVETPNRRSSVGAGDFLKRPIATTKALSSEIAVDEILDYFMKNQESCSPEEVFAKVFEDPIIRNILKDRPIMTDVPLKYEIIRIARMYPLLRYTKRYAVKQVEIANFSWQAYLDDDSLETNQNLNIENSPKVKRRKIVSFNDHVQIFIMPDHSSEEGALDEQDLEMVYEDDIEIDSKLSKARID